MFRDKVFEPTLTGFSYRIFIEGLKSINDIREQMNQILSVIQQNPMLAQVKPETLSNLNIIELKDN